MQFQEQSQLVTKCYCFEKRNIKKLNIIILYYFYLKIIHFNPNI